MPSDLDDIRKRLSDCPIPEDAMADYDGSNHYEIQTPLSEDGFWWLNNLDECLNSSTEDGKRLGAVLDYACHYRRDVKVLLDRISELERELDEWSKKALYQSPR